MVLRFSAAAFDSCGWGARVSSGLSPLDWIFLFLEGIASSERVGMTEGLLMICNCQAEGVQSQVDVAWRAVDKK